MEIKKYLKVTGRKIDTSENVCEAVAIVPYKKGGSACLSDVEPLSSLEKMNKINLMMMIM